MLPSRWIKITIFLVHLINVNAVCTVSQINDDYPYSLSSHSEARCTHISFQDIIRMHRSNTSIEVINITASDASFLNPGIFHDMNFVKRIYIKHSNIPEIIKGIFPISGALSVIDLSSSNISTIEEGSFKGWYRLKVLNISQNNLPDVRFFEESEGSYLQVFDLSHNNISNISGLSACKSVIHVNLSYNAITKLKSNQFVELTNLATLNLKGNSINNLEDDCFSNLNRLRFLELSDNQIIRIPVGSFKDTSSLTFLNLSANKIDSIALGTFVGLILLYTINLRFNKISFLHSEVLLDVQGIRELMIDHNSISNINAEDLVEYLTNLKYVSLDGNNWTCSKLSSIIKSFRSKGVTIEMGSSFKVRNLNGIACSGDGSKADQNRPDEGLNAAWENMKRYFGSDFKQSEFYEFFSSKLPQQFKDNFRNSNLFKHVDEDFVNSKFYKYFTDGYINATFFEYLDKKIEEMKTLREDVQFNRTDYVEMIKKTFSEYFSSMKPSSDYLRDLSAEEVTNNEILKTLSKLVIGVLFVLLLIWITLNVVACKLLKINASSGFVNFLKLGHRRKEVQNHEEQLL